MFDAGEGHAQTSGIGIWRQLEDGVGRRDMLEHCPGNLRPVQKL